MSRVEAKTTLAEEGVAFTRGEEMTASLGLYPLAADAIQEAFRFRQVERSEVGQINLWTGVQGTLRLGKKDYKIDALRGHSRMLVVSVAAETEVARDVLQASFELLREIEREVFERPDSEDSSPAVPVSQRGEAFTATIAIVRLPFRFEEMVPNAAFLNDLLNEKLLTQGKKMAKEPEFHLNWTLRLDIGPKNLNQAMILEPRAGDELASRMFYTRSPLPTKEHFEMLELLCDRVKPLGVPPTSAGSRT